MLLDIDDSIETAAASPLIVLQYWIIILNRKFQVFL